MVGEDHPIRLHHRHRRVGRLDQRLEAPVLGLDLAVLVGQLVALPGDRRQEMRIVKRRFDMAPYHSRELEILVVKCLGLRGAEGEGADDATAHAERDREHRNPPLRWSPQIGASLEVVDVNRVTGDDRLAGEPGRYGKAAGLRYKTAALPVIQGMDCVAGAVLGDEGDARAPYAEHARQFENGRPKDFVEVEGRVDERRQLGDDLEPCDGDALPSPPALGAEGGAHRTRSRAMTTSMLAVSSSRARRATMMLALVAAPLRSCHSLPNDSRRSA